ncbi:fusaric acid resistance protein-like domain-containing protein [Sarocladium implicatum]|nr:fusaric acid resistance protein-like domain-containing protein [Sarocladium implicatum]
MSSAAGTSTRSWLPDRGRSKRGKLRNGTFIVPSTGERSSRQFTLRLPRRSTGASAASNNYDESLAGNARYLVKRAGDKARAVWQWLSSEEGHQVLKCSFAYLLGSLGTFWLPLSQFLGHRDGKHIVATLTVYFHPARTAGSMFEAILIAVVAVIYAQAVCALSMGISIVLQDYHGHVASHISVLLFCIGGGLGFVGWFKAKMNQPLVNVASTLASIAIITVVTKEEAVLDGYWNGEKIVQVFKMLGLGIAFTAGVNLLIWPLSARRQLRASEIKATQALADKVAFITSAFLNGTEEDVKSTEFAQVTKQYNGAQAQMSKALKEAKFEHFFLGKENLYPLDKKLLKQIEALSQAVGGLRSALDTQFTLMKEAPQDINGSAVTSPTSAVPLLQRTKSMVIDESTEEDVAEPRVLSQLLSEAAPDQRPVFRSPADIFALFIELLGPSMKSLAYTLSETLRVAPFGTDPTTDITETEQLRESLREALTLYNQARGTALHELYRSIELGRSRSEATQADIEEVAAACGHFSFSLQAVAEEMDTYLDILDDLKVTTNFRHSSWKWLMFWRRIGRKNKPDTGLFSDPERDNLIMKPPAVRRLRNSAVPKGIPDSMTRRRDNFSWEASSGGNKYVRKISQVLLSVMRALSRDDNLFGFKVGIGATAWAMFAYIPATRPIYQHWRGEWGLLSFMIVTSMTTGAANTTGFARFLGTLIGAALAIISWMTCQGNPIALAAFGWAVAVWNFYLILVIKNAPLGRITQLAYNVVVLYSYSISQNVDDDDDDEGGTDPLIFNITYHRVVAVLLGIIWGIMVCRLLWPISGRRKFREGVAVLYLQLGLIWKRGPLGTVVESNSTLDYMREGEQAALQRYATKLETLRNAAKSEFELRGPFPNEAWGRIMQSTKHILDGFYAMRLITQKRHGLSEGELAVLEYTATERRLFCQRICHVFQVLASCIMLEYPLTDAIPTVDRVKDQLLGKIHTFRKEHTDQDYLPGPSDADTSWKPQGERPSAPEGLDERDYALLYAYTLVATQIAEELKKVRAEIEGLFGVLNEEAMLLE